ncbi:hypothetical protein F6X38_11885 [Aureimonas leprariae]|uniref:Uncharacterized protein n=1 Tax=Plantimonas leprariae TaxID=2615207 RepID=A0A7V7PNU6_9HYPH|nr:hypothetical protein F6X38_11885 [Aureimonas leprariae]
MKDTGTDAGELGPLFDRHGLAERCVQLGGFRVQLAGELGVEGVLNAVATVEAAADRARWDANLGGPSGDRQRTAIEVVAAAVGPALGTLRRRPIRRFIPPELEGFLERQAAAHPHPQRRELHAELVGPCLRRLPPAERLSPGRRQGVGGPFGAGNEFEGFPRLESEHPGAVLGALLRGIGEGALKGATAFLLELEGVDLLGRHRHTARVKHWRNVAEILKKPPEIRSSDHFSHV